MNPFNKISKKISVSSLLLLAACASQPMGPMVQVMPAANKPFQLFQQEQAECKSYAQSQIAGQVDAANNKAVGAAALGTVLGAGLGAAMGGGRGAGIGAAGGATLGTTVGAENSNTTQLTIQQQYDNAYSQCMYAKGNQVPGVMASAPPPPPGSSVPPPNAPPPR